jgi:hypothetical protein
MFHRPDVIKDKLYVISPIFNPIRYRTRWKHYKNFEKHIIDSGAHLITIEAIFGEREHAITETDHPNHTVIHVRTKHELWLKENLINIAIQRLSTHIDPHWKYVSYVDADFLFARPDWVGETLQQLQHHPIVQMFSMAAYLNHNYEITNTIISFMRGWKDGVPFKNAKGIVQDESFFHKRDHYGHHCHKIGWAGQPGGAWAYTREAINLLGGLYEYAILGSADYHMATALFGFAHVSLQEGYSTEFKQSVLDWQERAVRCIKKNVGFVEGTIIHYFHGKMVDRQYGDRWKILVKHKYSPRTDVKKDVHGVLQLEDIKHQLRDDISGYFRRRHEDSF